VGMQNSNLGIGHMYDRRMPTTKPFFSRAAQTRHYLITLFARSRYFSGVPS
jgi:hypothetical protein